MRPRRDRGAGAPQGLLDKYASLFEPGFEPCCIMDPTGSCLAANDAFCDLLGLPPGGAVGSLADLLVDGPGRDRVRARLADAADSGSFQRSLWHLRHADGTSRALRVSGFVERRGGRRFLVAFASPAERVPLREAPYRVLVNQLPVVTYTALLDGDFKVMFVGPQVEQLLGYKPDEVVSDPESCLRIIHPDDQEAMLAQLARCQVSGEGVECEYRVRAKDGRYIWVEDKASIVRDEQGRSYLHGVLIDVSERRKAQEELARRLSYERMLADVSAGAVAAADLDGFIEATLRRLGETTDVSRTYLFRLHGGRLFNTHEWVAQGVRPEKANLQNLDSGIAPYWMARMAADEVIATDVASLPEAERAILEPQEIISILAVPLSLGGELAGFVGFDECRARRTWSPDDIGLLRTVVRLIASAIERQEAASVLAESEEKYRSLVEHALAGVYIVQDGVFRFVNPRLAEIFGYRREELVGMSPLDLVAPEDKARVAEIMRRRQTGEVSSARATVRGITKQGQMIYVEALGSLTTYQGRPALHGTIVDVTERQRAEEALAESEEKYRSLVEHALAGVYVIQDGVFRFVNPRLAEISGYGREELIGMSPADLAIPEERGLASENIRRLLEGEVGFLSHTYRATTKQGRPLVVEVKSRLMTYQGRPALHGTVVDITERQRAEEALAESEEKYRSLVEQSPAGVYLIQDGLFRFVNPRLAEMLGYGRQELVGRNILEVIAPEDRPLIADNMKRRLEGESVPFHYTCRALTKEGRAIDVEIASSGRITYQGHPAVHGSVVDITERKRAEEALRRAEREKAMILEGLSEHVVYHDTQMRIVWANRAGAESAGRRPEELVGRRCFEVWAKGSQPCPGCPVVKALGTGQPQRAEMTHPDGRVWFIRGYPVHDASGEVVGLVEAALDITERKRAETRLKAMNECFLGFGAATDENINRLTAVCGELLGGTCALYNRLENGMLYSRGQWQTPPDYNPLDRPEGHICYDVIKRGGGEVLVVRDLPRTRYARTDPNVEAYGLRTYIGHPVKCGGAPVGSLCVVYQDDHEPTEDEKRLLGILAAAIGIEEERKQAEEALRESEGKLNAMVSSLPDHMSLISKDYEILWANETALRTFGEDIVGQKCYRAYHGRSTPCEPAICSTWKAFQNGQVHSHETQVTSVDGRVLDYLCTANVAMRDSQGEPTAVIEISRDVTERRRAEEALRKSEQFLSSIFASIQDCMAILDGELNIVRANPALERWCPHGAPLVGKKCYAAFHGRSEPCHPCPSLRTLETGEPAHIVCSKAGPDGEARWMDLYTFPLVDLATGQVTGVVEYGRDSTERKRAEEALIAARGEAQRHAEALGREQRLLEAVFENTQTLLAYLDRDFNFVRVNEAYARAGARSKEGYVGRNHFELHPAEAEEVFKQVRETGEPYEALARPFTHPVHPEWGETCWDWTLSPVKDAAGRVEGFVLSLVDVTARVRQQRQLEQASRLKDEFLSMASHELKTPVTSIKIFAELAARRPEIVQPKLMSSLTRQADQLVRLVNDVLDVSRLELGRMPVEMRRFDLARFLRELCERSRPLYGSHRLVFTIPGQPAMVSGDPTRLEQVFLNLLDNAAKYSPKGSAITLEAGLEGEGGVALSVKDEGIGISPEDLPHIFERFYKPRAQQAVYPGLGVGLYISRQIIERHGGRIWAESQADGGSVFRVWLPPED